MAMQRASSPRESNVHAVSAHEEEDASVLGLHDPSTMVKNRNVMTIVVLGEV
jgi:hypothetical protein